MTIYFTQKFFRSNVFCILVELLALLGRATPCDMNLELPVAIYAKFFADLHTIL